MENRDVNFGTVDPEKRRKARKAVSSMSLSDNAMFINAMKDKTLFEHVLRQIIGKEMEVIGEIESISTEFSDYLTEVVEVSVLMQLPRIAMATCIILRWRTMLRMPLHSEEDIMQHL